MQKSWRSETVFRSNYNTVLNKRQSLCMEVTNSVHLYTNKEICIHKSRPRGWQKWTQMETKDT